MAAHSDRIRLTTPLAGASVRSPLEIAGEARGSWFFEASFPVTLLDANGGVLARRPAQARGEWMTEEFVPFDAELTFTQPTTSTGTLVLAKDNPSGLAEHDAEVRIAVRFDAHGDGAVPAQDGAAVYAALAEEEYPLDLSPTGRVRLVHGSYEGASAPGSAAKLSVRLDKEWAVGDLNADGRSDAALILVAQSGGSGTFRYLALAANRGDVTKPMASVLLGDRVIVESVNIEKGEVVVHWLTRGPNQPMTAAPTTPKTNKYVLQGDKLIAR